MRLTSSGSTATVRLHWTGQPAGGGFRVDLAHRLTHLALRSGPLVRFDDALLASAMLEVSYGPTVPLRSGRNWEPSVRSPRSRDASAPPAASTGPGGLRIGTSPSTAAIS